MATSFRVVVVAAVALVAGLGPGLVLSEGTASHTSRRPDSGPLDGRRALVLWRITVALRLNPTTARSLFDTLDHHQDRVVSFRQRRHELMRQIQHATQAERDDAALLPLIDHWLRLQAERRSIRESRWRDLRGLLSSIQHAQLMVLLPKLEASL